jgi:hypothetical protein
MWGGSRDVRLLHGVKERFPSLGQVAKQRWTILQGFDLRDSDAEKKKPIERREALVPLPEVSGKPELLIASFKNERHVHSFPDRSLRPVTASRAYARRRGGTGALVVCKPPHVIVHAARNFSVFSEKFIVVPPPQIGIAGRQEDKDILRALALYLGSDFTWYQQFFTSPEMEYRGRSTIDALKRLPVPLLELGADDIRGWVDLHEQVVSLSDRRWALLASQDALVSEGAIEHLQEQIAALEETVNRLTARALGLSQKDEWLIEDLVQVRRHLADGKIGEVAAGPPTGQQLKDYALALRDELDAYLDRGRRFQHALTVVHEQRSAMVEIAFASSNRPHAPLIEQADSIVGRKLRAVRDRIDREHGQWLYFDRNLAMYLDGKAFLCKPMQRVWWTRSQALADADRIIADLVAAGARA